MLYENNTHTTNCSIWERFRQYYPPLNCRSEVKLEQDDVTRICQRVVDHGLDTQFVADQFEISRRRVQQLAKEYRDSGDIPQIETPGRKPYAEYPDDLEERVLEIHQTLAQGAVAVAHVLRVRDGLTIDNNVVHEILQEHEHVTENPRKQGRRRPWVRFERTYSLVTAHMDWYYNDADQWCLAVQDDASRKILEVITDHGSEFYAPKRDEEDEASHEFEEYLDTHRIQHTLCAVGRPQSNGKLERFFQTYEKQRWRFGTLSEFLTFYNEVRPHMSLDWDNLETPSEAFDRLLPVPPEEIDDPFATEVKTDE